MFCSDRAEPCWCPTASLRLCSSPHLQAPRWSIKSKPCSKNHMMIEMQCDPCVCPLCGNPNNCQLCGMVAYKGPCWCATVSFPDPLLARIPLDLRSRACICRACVRAFCREQPNSGQEPIRPGDFYFDQNSLMVFTAAYHLRRGHCCGSGCRHCPYRSGE